MHDWQCEEVVRQWKKNLFEPYRTAVNSFVWDDGWDHYGDWTFSPNFPDGFRKADALAREIGARASGAWLGPVGRLWAEWQLSPRLLERQGRHAALQPEVLRNLHALHHRPVQQPRL